MTKTRMVLGSALLGAVAFAWIGVGRAQEGVGEKVGESLDEAGKAIKRGLQRSGEAVRESFARTKTSVQNMGIEARIFGRLHWDRDINGSPIELEVRDASVAILKGSVPSAAVKSKAVALARDTVGVSQVIDQLTVNAPTRVVPGGSRGTGDAPTPRPVPPSNP
jgi:osmotically-inducible protein OsmY